MATYNAAAVSDAVIAFRKGITLNQIRQLRDNMLAIAEGASGAPKVELDALEIAETTATGTLLTGGSPATITRPSTRSLFPNVSVTSGSSADLDIVLNDTGLILSNSGGGNIGYSVVWPYLRNTP